MTVSIETYDIRNRFGDRKAFEMIKDAGFDGIDYSFYLAKPEHEMLGDNYMDIARVLRAKLDALGLSCDQGHAPFGELSYGCAFSTENRGFLRVVRAIEFSSVLGIKNLVVHMLPVPEDVDVYKYNYGFYKAFEPYCEKYGVCISVENLFDKDGKGGYTDRRAKPEKMNEMVDALGKYYNICVDIGHAGLVGYEPEDFIRMIGNRHLKVLHIHDNDRLSDLHTLPYLGSYNWDNILSSLGEVGYDGDFNFEVMHYLEKFPDDIFPAMLTAVARLGKVMAQKVSDALQ